MKLKCQKYSENSKEMTFFSDVLCLSRLCLEALYTIYNVYFRSSPLLNACLAKAKNNYLTNTPKLENAVSIKIIVHKVHLMIGQSGNVCLSIYLFTGIPVTIYSTIELSDSVIVLGITPQNLRKNPGGAVDRNRSSPGCHF